MVSSLHSTCIRMAMISSTNYHMFPLFYRSLSLSIASKVSYLNLLHSKERAHYLLTQQIALIKAYGKPAHIPLDIFKYSIKIGWESILIQTNIHLNEDFAMNSKSILIQVFATRQSIAIKTLMWLWEWTVYKREEGRLFYGEVMAEGWQEMLLPI